MASKQSLVISIIVSMLSTRAVTSTNSTGSPYVTKIVCFGQSLRLTCALGEELKIRAATYRTLDQQSAHLCPKNTGQPDQCAGPQTIKRVRRLCEGKSECSLGYGEGQVTKVNCRVSMYFDVSYRCSPNAGGRSGVISPVSATVSTGRNTSSDTFGNPINSVDENPINPAQSGHGNMIVLEQHKSSLYFTLLGVFVDVRLAGEYMKNHSLSLILCVVTSFASGILILILYALVFNCCWKNRRKRRSKRRMDVDNENNNSTKNNNNNITPLGINNNPDYNTVNNNTKNQVTVSTSTKYSSSPSDVSRLPLLKESKESRKVQLISTIRRTHSVDECTQTNFSSDDENSLVARTENSCTLTPSEMRELGYLVADMKVYESEIKSSINDMMKTQRTSHRTSLNSGGDGGVESDNDLTFYYSGPSNSPYPETSRFQNTGTPPFPTGPLTEKGNNSIYGSSNAMYGTIKGHEGAQSGTLQRDRENKQGFSEGPIRDPCGTLGRELRRFPSELSYTTSTSNASGDEMGPREPYMLGDAGKFGGSRGRLPCMQRNNKLGVRGDGFDYIGTR